METSLHSYAQMSAEVTTYSGSDWAGDKGTPTSSSGNDSKPHVESTHAQATYHCEKQCRGRFVRCNIGSIRVERNCVDDV